MSPQLGGKFETESRQQQDERNLQIVLTFLRRLEAMLGFLAVLSTGAVMITATLYAAIAKTPDTGAGLLVVAGIIAILLPGLVAESVLLCVLGDKFRLGWKPLPLMFALHMRRWPLILRPIAGLWWTAHFLLGVVIALKIEIEFTSSVSACSDQIQMVIFLAIGFSVAFAFNLYAMLALAAFGFSERFIRIAWKWRLTFDFIIAIAALALPMKSYEYNRNFLFLYEPLLLLRNWLRTV